MLGVARDVARAMDGYKVIVDKSTVPVGTAEKVREVMRRETTHPFSVVSNPEFLKQGAAVDDFLKPDRVVIGADDERGGQIMVELYTPFTRTGAPIMVMDCASAELCKYAANAMLATRISFMNEIAKVCELYGADVDQVRQAVASDNRIGPSFLFPGVGYGGSCFPKDVKAILKFSTDKGYDFKILEAVEAVNEQQKQKLLQMMRQRTSARSRARPSPCGGWRSSRGPTTCARRRPSRSSRGCSRRARRCRPTIPKRSRPPGASSAIASPTARTPTTRSRAPTRWRWSPSGTNSASPTSPA